MTLELIKAHFLKRNLAKKKTTKKTHKPCVEVFLNLSLSTAHDEHEERRRAANSSECT